MQEIIVVGVIPQLMYQSKVLQDLLTRIRNEFLDLLNDFYSSFQ